MIPVTVITGFLGSGKTTAILDLLARRPVGERWAVLVNEFGAVGIDGPTMANEGFAVREIAGGCVCCSAGPQLRVGLVRLIREVQPDRILIEPTGLAHPASILDMLRSPGLGVDPKATITLVDPRRIGDPRVEASDTWRDQWAVADVLVANFGDVASETSLQTFRAAAKAQWPPKKVVAEVSQGKLDLAWLDLDSGPPTLQRAHFHAEPEPPTLPESVDRPTSFPLANAEAATCGWLFPVGDVFDRDRLQQVLQQLVRPNPALPGGVVRLKGIFRVAEGWQRVDATPERIQFQSSSWRGDSRVEVIAPANPLPNWDQVEHRWIEAQRRGSK